MSYLRLIRTAGFYYQKYKEYKKSNHKIALDFYDKRNNKKTIMLQSKI